MDNFSGIEDLFLALCGQILAHTASAVLLGVLECYYFPPFFVRACTRSAIVSVQRKLRYSCCLNLYINLAKIPLFIMPLSVKSISARCSLATFSLLCVPHICLYDNGVNSYPLTNTFVRTRLASAVWFEQDNVDMMVIFFRPASCLMLHVGPLFPCPCRTCPFFFAGPVHRLHIQHMGHPESAKHVHSPGQCCGRFAVLEASSSHRARVCRLQTSG